MISVIIATKDRSNELVTVSLPSLLKQNSCDFEVVVWDASDDDRSLDAVNKIQPCFRDRGICIAYHIAPRTGSASQRNDAVKVARGVYVFFVDDDSEVSPDGISGLQECFENNPDAMGAALIVDEFIDGSYRSVSGSRIDLLKDRIFKFIGYRRTRKVNPSGSAKGLYALSGPAEWLSGCSMAFRRRVFDSMGFNESLETFGPYALGEDIEFSHRVFLHYGHPLFLAEKGKVIHKPAPESRFSESERFIASKLYNRYLTMKVASVHCPVIGRLGYCWFLIKNIVVMPYCYGVKTAFQGFAMALGGLRELGAKGEPTRKGEAN